MLRTHGAEPQYDHREIGGNFQLDALQAAVLRVKLPYLPEWNGQRRANAARYRELFERFGLLPRVRVPNRDAVRRHLAGREIGTDIHYPVPFHRQECFTTLEYSLDAFPNADAAAATVLAVPICPELTAMQQEHVVRVSAEALA